MTLHTLITHAATTGQPLTDTALHDLNAATTGLDATLGIHYTHLGPDGATAHLTVAEHHLQPAGLVNGGVFCALAESTGSLAGLYAAAGTPVVGVTNTTDLISSVRTGTIHAHATPLHLGRRTQLWEIRMTHNTTLAAHTTLRTMIL